MTGTDAMAAGSPAARALMVLEMIQDSPGITAQRLADRMGVTERAVRRSVATLRDAGIPIESATGRYGGYRIGRGLRLAPLMFSPAEAMGLVMAVLEGHRGAADPADIVGGALAKILRVLPVALGEPVRAYRAAASAREAQRGSEADEPSRPDPAVVAELLGACNRSQRVRVLYQLQGPVEPGRTAARPMDVDPWSVVLRHSRWYLLCWSQRAGDRRVLRVDRIKTVTLTAHYFRPPEELDALRLLEEQLSSGWPYPVEVLIEAPVREAARHLPRSLGSLEPVDETACRLVGSTENIHWYARRLAVLPMAWRVVQSEELRHAVLALASHVSAAAGQPRLSPGRRRASGRRSTA